MLFSVRGRFANGHTFNVNPVDAETPHKALESVTGSDEIKNFGHAVTMVTVKTLSGKNKKIKISDKPAAERKKKTDAPTTETETETETDDAPPAAAPPAARGGTKQGTKQGSGKKR